VSQPVLKRPRVASDASTTGDAQAASDASRGASQTGRRCARDEQRERGEHGGRGIEMGGERGGDGDGLGTRWRKGKAERGLWKAGQGRSHIGHIESGIRIESESEKAPPEELFRFTLFPMKRTPVIRFAFRLESASKAPESASLTSPIVALSDVCTPPLPALWSATFSVRPTPPHFLRPSRHMWS
jgi:hypothetical protein